MVGRDQQMAQWRNGFAQVQNDHVEAYLSPVSPGSEEENPAPSPSPAMERAGLKSR
jgi:hypothetical protein